MRFYHVPWLVFAVGFVAIIDAENEEHARAEFRTRVAAAHDGREMVIGEEELRARPLRLDDEGWIMSAVGDPPTEHERVALEAIGHLKRVTRQAAAKAASAGALTE